MGPQQLVKEGPIEPEFVDELKPGTQLQNGQYTISRFLNSGGFGITYVARNSLNREVVIKECFPGAFCRRSNAIVAARSRAHQSEFRSIVRLFVQEAHNLAKLVHPNIVGVHQVFEDNDTAYMVIDYIHGSDLLDVIETASVKMTPSSIVAMTRKLLNAVAFIHENGILHRDISPDNILIDQTGEPILIDFGAAREEASRASRALSALRVVKDGYSPQELYIAGSEQGPWSDLYALGASIYHTISGVAPVNSQARLAAIVEGREDPHLPLAGRFAHFPEGFLESIDMAMNSLPRKRIQSARDWLAMLDHRPIQTNTENIDSLVTAMVAADLASKEEEAIKGAEPTVNAAEPPVSRKRILPSNDWSVLLDPPPVQTILPNDDNPEAAPVGVDPVDNAEGEKISVVRPVISEEVNAQPRRCILPENDWLARIEQRQGQTNTEQIDSLVTAMVAADLASKEEEGAEVAEQFSKATEMTSPPAKKRTSTALSAESPAQSSLARFALGTVAGMVMGLAGVIYLSSSAAGETVSTAAAAITQISALVAKPANLVGAALWESP